MIHDENPNVRMKELVQSNKSNQFKPSTKLTLCSCEKNKYSSQDFKPQPLQQRKKSSRRRYWGKEQKCLNFSLEELKYVKRVDRI